MIRLLKKIVRETPLFYKVYNHLLFLLNSIRIKPLIGFVLQPGFSEIRVNGFKNTFCGYYDVSPFNDLNPNLILVHANNQIPSTQPKKDTVTSVGIYNLMTNKYEEIGKTKAWNWQQGARLQWLNSEIAIYNNYDPQKQHITGRIVNVKTKEYSDLPLPLQSCYKNEYMLSLDYGDLSKFSEYGYHHLKFKQHPNGISIYYFKDKKIQQLVTREKIGQYFTTDYQHNNHINHILISPDGSKFIFTYRFYFKNKRSDNIFVYDFPTNQLTLVIRKQTVSHCTWRNNDEILFWGIIDNIEGYYILLISSGSIKSVVHEPNDGHPTFINNYSFIADTYPDRKWFQHLYIYNLEDNAVKKIVSLPHPVIINTSSTRCDLHPSISFDKKKFQIDSRIRNVRSVIIGDLKFPFSEGLK